MTAQEVEPMNGRSRIAYLDVTRDGLTPPSTILKRDGRVVAFDIERIENALTRCFASLNRKPQTSAPELARRVVNIIAAKSNADAPTVEGVQDIVEMVLQAAGEFEAAKRYILYRAEHAQKRIERPIPEQVRLAFAESDQYFPSPLQKFQFFDKYSRFNYDLGRRETWIETVDRSVDFLYELAGTRLPAETYARVRRGILEMRSMPSMRLLAMAGAAARRNNVAIYNCLSGDEKILTHERGLIALRDSVGTVTVLNKNREWVPAEVRSFGQQQIVEIEFGRYKSKKVIRATLNHDWVLTDGRRVTTEELRPGDEIAYTVASRVVNIGSIDYRLGLMHGIIYGDGAETYAQERNNGYVIRLCGDSRELLECFAGYPHSFPPTYGGDPVVYLYDDFAKTHQLKSLPNVAETDDYLVGFIRGWFAADGYLSKQGQILFAADEAGEEFLRRAGPKVGFDFGYATLMPDETNYGVRNQKVRNVEVRRASVAEEDFFLSKHLRNYREATTDRDWKFLGIVPGSSRVEEVFCATVPETHTFTLADGILTGNCSYQPVESIDSFVEALTISMSGCGVGYSVESRYVENFPRIKRQTGKQRDLLVVEDSAEGWANALRTGLETWFEGSDIRFDLSQLRQAGAALKTKGGRASGPEPLRVMLDFVRARVLARQGSFLRPLDGHDMMCAVGNAAVSGGVRRTAMISLFDYDDDEMRLSKNGDFERDNNQRWNANNSAVWPAGGRTQVEYMHQFLEMVESGRGEPGIFNREAALSMRPERRRAADFGTNPSLRKGTLVYTSTGIVPIEELENKTFLVRNLNGELSEATCFLSGRDKPLYKITLKGGHIYYATAEHKWPILQPDGSITKLTTPAVLPGMHFPLIRPTTLDFGDQGDYEDGFLAGWLLGDGWITRRDDNDQLQFGLMLSEQDQTHGIGDKLEATLQRLGVASTFQPRQRDASTWYEINTQSTALAQWAQQFGVMRKSHGLPQSVWTTASEEFRRGLIDGLFSSDGSIDLTKQPGYIVLILTSAHRKLVDDVSALLGFYGIKTIIRESSATTMFPNGKDYERAYTRYDLTISGIDDINHFKALFALTHPAKQAKLAATKEREKPHFGSNGVKVVSVEVTDLKEDVWDISVLDETHCFQLAHCITGNCGEILLRPWQFCNLSAAVARKDDTFESLRDKVEVAAIIGTIQSLATYFPGLRPQWKQNCDDERLLGVDITGQMDSPIAQDAEVKPQLRQIAIDVNRQTAAALGINQSAAITCVKPSGNSSQLLDCSSGLHARWAPYYIRNVRVATHSPLYKVLRDASVPMDPENGQTPENANTWVIHFPVKAPEGSITREDRSAIQQCEFWLQNKLHWTEHNPSCTITYRPDEVLDVMKWVWEHRDQIGGLSFLPAFDAKYDNMPYVEITREEFEQRAAAFPEIDFSKVYRYEEEDLTNAAQELACSSGYCEIDI